MLKGSNEFIVDKATFFLKKYNKMDVKAEKIKQ